MQLTVSGSLRRIPIEFILIFPFILCYSVSVIDVDLQIKIKTFKKKQLFLNKNGKDLKFKDCKQFCGLGKNYLSVIYLSFYDFKLW